jgi:BirA family biotin operon repressor/biotin-[acetyl-CoA-carboxylase] ligase
LKHNYTTKLYQIEKASKYRQNGEVFEGTIKGITDSGLLLLENQGVIKEYNLKEIEFLNPIK